MAKEELISSLYPPPPPYVKFFTDENLNKLEDWKVNKAQQQQQQQQRELQDGESKEEEEEEDIVPPGELRFLVPPKAPEGSHYRGYGNIWSFEDKLPSLKSANWEQLYPDDDESITSETKIKELHKLSDSLLLNFLELIGIASIDPQQYQGKIKDISLILININHLLNTYRPHQSRESLIMLLRKQIDVKRNEINQIDKISSEIKAKIVKLTQIDDLKSNDSIEFEQFSKRIASASSASSGKDAIRDDIITKLLSDV
ncbi:mediator of RNA polymerase II transcription subunit 7 [Scheffersomyces coipomensis]|uniref:mediator of RNA polymerase II transcription subunit 7 n=1 Tax=Scheffersomyces coipomensis TaxID=1788519 RepID=UPI00315C58EE